MCLLFTQVFYSNLQGGQTPSNSSMRKADMAKPSGPGHQFLANALPGSLGFPGTSYCWLPIPFSKRRGDQVRGLTDGIMYKAARNRELTPLEKIDNRQISSVRGRKSSELSAPSSAAIDLTARGSRTGQGRTGVSPQHHNFQSEKRRSKGGLLRIRASFGGKSCQRRWIIA